MTVIYLLWHQNPVTDDDKLIGVFSTEENALDAMHHTSKLPGFKVSQDCFTVDKYEVDRTHWITGFGGKD